MSRGFSSKALCGLLLCAVSLRAADGDIASTYTATAKKLTEAAQADPHSLDRLEYLCDRIGNRLSGSESLRQAIAWAAQEMKAAGLQNVQTPKVKVLGWVRGAESATLLTPLQRKLPILGLGNSVGTSPDGLTADVVAVTTFDELNALGKEGVRGKIVLFNAPYQGYGRTVMYRVSGASRAAALGAVGMLLRSVTPLTLRSPHTGTLVYSPDAPQIPAAALTIEDSESLYRLIKRGNKVRVNLKMDAHFEGESDAANVIGEIPGSEKPDEVVVIGGHIDSWDVGQGAQDDGSGIMASLEAAALIQRLGLKPRRTIRVVFWVNEENGGAGGRAYRAMVGNAIRNHVAAIEMDGGAEKPMGFGIGMGGRSRARLVAPLSTAPGSAPADSAPPVEPVPARTFDRLQEIGALLTPIGANHIIRGGGGSDIEPLMEAGVPGLGEMSSGTHYFDWHHTEADTFDKINPQDFRESVAAMAVMTYVLADMPERLADLK